MMSALLALLKSEVNRHRRNVLLDDYFDAISHAMEREPPPFQYSWYGDTFRKCAVNPFWLIQCLISNSIKEGEGARSLWEFSHHVSDQEIRNKVRKHAMDEARHARMYIGLICIVFPNALSDEDVETLRARAPKFSESEEILDKYYHESKIYDILIQINLGEFRTRLHQLLMQPVLEVICGDVRSTKLEQVMNSIAHDELEHLCYTAELIDEWIGRGNSSASKELFLARLKQFNSITMREVGTQNFTQ